MVPSAPIENLLDEYLLVWIFELYSIGSSKTGTVLRWTTYGSDEIIGVRIDGFDHRVESFDASDAVFNKLPKFHFY